MGAIELSTEPELQLKQWKRILEDGSTIDAPEIKMSIWKFECFREWNETAPRLLLSLYHGLSIARGTEATSDILPCLDSGFFLKSVRDSAIKDLLFCDWYLITREFVRAAVCYNNLSLIAFEDWKINNRSMSKSEEALLAVHLMLRATHFLFLFGAAPPQLSQFLVVASRMMSVVSIVNAPSNFVKYYSGRILAMDNIFSFYFGSFYKGMDYCSNNSCVNFELLAKDLLEFERLGMFVANELSHCSVASEYLDKVVAVSKMIITYQDKGFPLLSLFLSLSNYAVQSGAAEQSAAFLCAGIEHHIRMLSGSVDSLAMQSLGASPDSTLISLLPYALRLQYYLTVNSNTRRFLLEDSESLQAVLSVLTQLCMPVILPSYERQRNWWEEAVELRIVAIDTFAALDQICATRVESCHLNVHHRGSGVRGLFLAAYQGVSLVNKLNLSLSKSFPNHYFTDNTLPEAYYRFLKSVTLGNEAIAPFALNLPNEKELDAIHHHQTRPISIVFICYSISRHSVGRLLAKLIHHVVNLRDSSNRPIFEVYIISNKFHPVSNANGENGSISKQQHDEIFLDIASLFEFNMDRWITLPPFDFSQERLTTALQYFASDGKADVLFDIAIFSDLLMQASQCIWAHEVRIARNQIVFWGHPQTSGMSTMDFYITSESFEDSSLTEMHHRQNQYSEQLVQFDSLSLVLFDAEPIASALPNELPIDINSKLNSRDRFMRWLQANSDSLSNQKDTLTNLSAPCRLYGSIQTLMKYHPLMDHMLFDLLISDAHAVVILLKSSNNQAHWLLRFQRRLYQYFQFRIEMRRQDIRIDDLLSRVRWISPMPHQQYARVVCHLDVSLDPFIFGGGVTLCDGIAGNCFESNSLSKNSSETGARKNEFISHSVGFVTAGKLQSVHRIGAGIAFKIGDSSLTVNAGSTDALGRNGTEVINSVISEYVREAIRLAKLSESRRHSVQHQEYESLLKQRNEIHRLIFNNQQVLNEYSAFFQRLVSKKKGM